MLNARTEIVNDPLHGWQAVSAVNRAAQNISQVNQRPLAPRSTAVLSQIHTAN